MNSQEKKSEQIECSEKSAAIFMGLSAVFLLLSYFIRTTELWFLFASLISVAVAYYYYTSKQ